MGLSRDLGREKNQWEEGDGKGSTVHMQWVLRCVMRETGREEGGTCLSF